MSGEEDDRYEPAVYDGGPGFTPGRSGRSYYARSGHPPIDCPNPKISAGMRGLYRCPCCSAKVRHAGQVSWRESGYEFSDRLIYTVADAVKACWDLARDTLRGLPRTAEVAIGLALVLGPVLGYLSVEGWIPR